MNHNREYDIFGVMPTQKNAPAWRDIMEFKTISAKEIDRYVGNLDTIIIDLRDSQDYNKAHIPSAINIPYEVLEEKIHLLNKYKQIVIYCERGGISMLAARQLSALGYGVVNVAGGIHAYRGKLSIDDRGKVFHNK